jgi:hypothetical protein
MIQKDNKNVPMGTVRGPMARALHAHSTANPNFAFSDLKARRSEQVNDRSPRSALGHRRGDALPAEKFRQVLARVEHPGLYGVHWNSNDPRDIFD